MQFKRMVSFTLCAVATAAALYGGPAAAAEKTLRVALSAPVGNTIVSTFSEPMLENAMGSTGYQIGAMVTSASGTHFAILTEIPNTQLTIRVVDDCFQICDSVSGDILYTSENGVDHLAIHPNSSLTWFKGYKWYGDFVYRRAAEGKLTVINYVDLEDYVKGVLPYEADPDWPLEALKAQAVCVRSFALCTTKHQNSAYDLCNTTDCQVYYGANMANANSDSAVDQTKNEYLLYNDEIVEGNFFSSDGGATEDAANVWGGNSPYLKGKVDPYEAESSNWSVTLTADEIRQKLLAAGYTIGEVSSVLVTKRTPMDNVNELTITDTNGKVVKLQQGATRTVLGLHSIRYTVTPNFTSGAASGTLPQVASLRVNPSTHKVSVNGVPVTPQGYNINGNNYYKLRDIAYVLSGTACQFNVTWSQEKNRIQIAAGEPYEAVGGEMAQSVATQLQSCAPSTSAIYLNNAPVSLTGYSINGNNYYKVRDLGTAIGFEVGFENDTVMIQGGMLDPEGPNPQTTKGAESYTFNGSGWGHSVGMSQWGAYAMAQAGRTYKDILQFYYTGVEIGS